MNYNPSIHKLSNGVTVILDPMELETTYVKVHFSTGSRDEAPNEYGLTHFCEHMLCKGTPRFPSKKSIDDYLDYHGGTTGALTGNARLEFYGRILGDNLNVLIDFLGDRLQNSLFDPDKIEIERSVICDELRRALDDDSRQFTDFLSKELFNYATFSYRNLGTFENINSFTRDQMLDFLSQRLSAKNCIIGISGCINNTASVLDQLEKSFAFLPTHFVEQNTAIEYTPTVAHNSKGDKQNVRLCIGMPDIWSMDYSERYNNICVGRYERYLLRRIGDILRQDNGLVYGFGGFGIGNEKITLTGYTTQTSVENLEQVVALIAKNSYDIYHNLNITAEDLDRYFRKDRLGEANWLETSSDRCNKLISFYEDYMRTYDMYGTTAMFRSITVADVYKYSRGYYDGPISIITQGADYTTDLMGVWYENFK